MTGIDYVKLSGCPKTFFHCQTVHSLLMGSSLNPSPIQTKSLKMFSGSNYNRYHATYMEKGQKKNNQTFIWYVDWTNSYII